MGKLSPRRLAALVVEAFSVEGWRGASAPESERIRGSGEAPFPLSEKNLKHLFWRRLRLSFSFKVLTKKEDGVNSSRLSSGNPAALCRTERMGK